MLEKKNALLLSILSAVILIFAFPKTDFSFLIWVGLIPLLFALEEKQALHSFFIAYLCGVIFFAGTLYWFIHVTWLGAILMVLYCGVYFGIFGLAHYFFSGRKLLTRMLLLASTWTVLEFARAHVISGFDWVSLGQSQYKHLSVIQIADVTGMVGISFVIVLVNIGLMEFIKRIQTKQTRDKEFLKAAFVLGIILGTVYGYGHFRLNETQSEQDKLSVAVIQANIPQDMKWYKPAWPDIMDKYKVLTLQAALDKPDLIIWPETSFPGYKGVHDELFEQLKDFVDEIDIPLLLGSIVKEEKKYFNSTVLISKEGEGQGQYNKLHLVPFGEYIPLRSYFPFLSKVVPIADFNSGEDYTLFKLDEKPANIFSTLICFEDTVARVARQFVKKGAQLLINVTNDAWFKDTKQPFMHMQSAVFRTVENRRSLIRATNTGISCFIDRYGRILKRVENAQGKPTYVLGHMMGEISFNRGMTFYTKYGDIFAYLCMIYVFTGLVGSQLARKSLK